MPNSTLSSSDALLFVTNLNSDATLRESWKTLVAKVVNYLKGKTGTEKDKAYEQGLQLMDNFISEKGYSTTADAVMKLLKSPLYEEHLKESQPNKDSDRFVQTLMTNSEMYKQWQSLLVQVAASEKTIDSLNAFLNANGFKCTYKQINASYVKMRNHNLNYWSGAYDTTKQKIPEKGDSGKPEEGPVLVIYGKKAISLDDKVLTDTNHVTYANGELSWKSNDLLENFSGDLTFSEITMPDKSSSYKGPIVNGTLIYPGDSSPFHQTPKTTYSLYGQLTPKPKHSDKIPLGEHKSLIDKIAEWLNYLIAGIFILKTLGSMVKKYNKVEEFTEDAGSEMKERIDQVVKKGKSYESEVKDETSPFEDLDFIHSNVIQDLQEEMKIAKETGDSDREQQIEEEMKEEAEKEEEYDNEGEREADPEGDGWGKDLGEVFEEV